MQTSITETINRLAHGFLTPYATSCPELPLAERLERVAQMDRAYAVALVHGVFADAHQDPRIAGLAEHPRLMDAVTRLTAPWQLTGQIIRVRVNIPSFPQTRSPWHQDATDQHSPIVMACWMPLVDATDVNGTLEVLPGVYEEPYPHQQTVEGSFICRRRCSQTRHRARSPALPAMSSFGSVSAASYPAQSDDNDPLEPGDVAERSPAVTEEVRAAQR